MTVMLQCGPPTSDSQCDDDDDITCVLLKYIYYVIYLQLYILINKYFETGYIPELLQLAKLIHI